MDRRPVIIITMGDPAGIGPEIAPRVFANEQLFGFCRPVVIGDAGVMAKAVTELALPLQVRTVSSPAEASATSGVLPVLDLGLVDLGKHCLGQAGDPPRAPRWWST